jgi:hypothetical protein
VVRVRTWLGGLGTMSVIACLAVGGFAAACSGRSSHDVGEGGTGHSAGAAGTAGSAAGRGGTNTSGGSAGSANGGATGGTDRSGGTAGDASAGTTGGTVTNGGAAGDASGGATGGTDVSGGSAGDASGGASGGSAGDASGGTSGGSAGDASGGASGGATGGTSGSGGDWAATCNGVTMVGRCVGEVYEWCDYFERGLKRIDCGAIGLTCRAEPHELSSDYTNAGCFGGTCTPEDNRCHGTLAFQCLDGENTVHDCAKSRGPEATCGDGAFNNASCHSASCEPDRRVFCDGNVAVVCYDSLLHIENCAEYDPAGTCVEIDPTWVMCGGRNLQTP